MSIRPGPIPRKVQTIFPSQQKPFEKYTKEHLLIYSKQTITQTNKTKKKSKKPSMFHRKLLYQNAYLNCNTGLEAVCSVCLSYISIAQEKEEVFGGLYFDFLRGDKLPLSIKHGSVVSILYSPVQVKAVPKTVEVAPPCFQWLQKPCPNPLSLPSSLFSC